jgi:hypothetical protein
MRVMMLAYGPVPHVIQCRPRQQTGARFPLAPGLFVDHCSTHSGRVMLMRFVLLLSRERSRLISAQVPPG